MQIARSLNYAVRRIKEARALRWAQPVFTFFRPAYLRLITLLAGNRGLLLTIDGEEVRLCSEFSHFPQQWEPGVSRMLRAALKPGGVFYDVGAYVGTYTLLAARRVGAGGMCYSFEPSQVNVDFLRRHLEFNRVGSRAEVFRAAVGREDGQLEMSIASEISMTNRAAAAAPGTASVKVPCIALDSFATTHRPPTVIKIDVEGAELLVLQGAKGILRDQRPIIVCSIHLDWLRDLGGSYEAVESLAAELRYKVYRLADSSFSTQNIFEIVLLPAEMDGAAAQDLLALARP